MLICICMPAGLDIDTAVLSASGSRSIDTTSATNNIITRAPASQWVIPVVGVVAGILSVVLLAMPLVMVMRAIAKKSRSGYEEQEIN